MAATGPENFDSYVERLGIAPEEYPAAFAAWLNETSGWDGDVSEVDPPPGQHGPTADYGDDSRQ